MAPDIETQVRTSRTIEWLIVHIPSGDWSSITFEKGNNSLATIVKATSISTMSVDNALTCVAFTSGHADYHVSEVY